MSHTEMYLLLTGIVFLFALAAVYMATHWGSFKLDSWIADDPHNGDFDAHPDLRDRPRTPDDSGVHYHVVTPAVPAARMGDPSQRRRALAPASQLARLHYPSYCPICLMEGGIPEDFPKGAPRLCSIHSPTASFPRQEVAN